MMKANQIPLEVDVWNAIESELKSGLKEISRVSFHHSTKMRLLSISVDYYQDGNLESKHFDIHGQQAEDFMIRICERFNVEWRTIRTLRFRLEPGNIPTFDIEVYPFVSDVTTLDNTKNRRNPLTID